MSSEISSRKIDLSAKKISAGWPKIGYSNDSQVVDFYRREAGSTKDRHSMFYGKKLADIFIYAMAIGKNFGIKEGYQSPVTKNRNDNIDFEYIASNSEYFWMMIAVAMDEAKKNNEDVLEIFDNPREKIIDVCESYANYGIKLLIELDKKGSTADPLFGYEEKFIEILEQND